jgi:hypothetical protein
LVRYAWWWGKQVWLAYPYTHADGHSHANPHADPHTDTNLYSNTDGYPHTHHHADPNTMQALPAPHPESTWRQRGGVMHFPDE